MRRRLAKLIQKRLFQGNLLYRIQLDGRLDNFDQRLTTDMQVLLDGVCCVFFGNTNDYIAYPLGFTITRFICAYKNTFDPPNQSYDMGGEARIEIFFAVLVCIILTFLIYLLPMTFISRRVRRDICVTVG